jgi:hypothetical protein
MNPAPKWHIYTEPMHKYEKIYNMVECRNIIEYHTNLVVSNRVLYRFDQVFSHGLRSQSRPN